MCLIMSTYCFTEVIKKINFHSILAKMELILNDGLETLPCGHSNGELSTPPSPVSFDYHSEENCLKCFNYLETPETGPHLSKEQFLK